MKKIIISITVCLALLASVTANAAVSTVNPNTPPGFQYSLNPTKEYHATNVVILGNPQPGNLYPVVLGKNETFTHVYSFYAGSDSSWLANLDVGFPVPGTVGIANLLFEWDNGDKWQYTDALGLANSTTTLISHLLAGSRTFTVTGTSLADGGTYDFTLVSAVPVPAAFWLFGSALIGFIGFSRRRAA